MSIRKTLGLILVLIAFGSLFADQTVKGDEKAALNSARIFLTQGNWEKALAKFEVVLVRYPDNIESLAGAGDITMKLLEDSLKVNKEQRVDMYFKAMSLYKRALDALNNPENLETNKAKHDKQLELKNNCQKFYRSCWANLFVMATNLYRSADYDKSLALCTRLLEVNPAESRIFLTIANIYGAKGDNAKKNEYMAKAAEADHNDGSLQSYVGSYFFEQKQYAEALKYFKAASAVEPDSTSHYFNIAYSYSLLGDSVQAFNVMKTVVELSPNDIDALIQCSNYAYQMGDPEGALEYNRRAADVGTDNPDVYMQLCFKYYKKITDIKAQADPLREQLAKMKAKDPARPQVEAQIADKDKAALPVYQQLLKYVKPWLDADPSSIDAMSLGIEAAKAVGDTALEAKYQAMFDAQQ